MEGVFLKRDLYPAKSIDMDLHVSRIVGTERFGQPPQKVWLAECKTVAYKPEMKQYFKQGSLRELSISVLS